MYTCFLGNNVTRVIYYFRWIEISNNNYIDTIQLLIPGYDSYDRESETLLLYCDKDGKTLKLKPVSCDNRRSIFMVKEVSYRMLSNAENQRGYFDVNISEDEAANHLSVFRYYQRKSFFVYPYSRSMSEIDFYHQLDNYYYTFVKTE